MIFIHNKIRNRVSRFLAAGGTLLDESTQEFAIVIYNGDRITIDRHGGVVITPVYDEFNF